MFQPMKSVCLRPGGRPAQMEAKAATVTEPKKKAAPKKRTANTKKKATAK